jgi:phage-related holin
VDISLQQQPMAQATVTMIQTQRVTMPTATLTRLTVTRLMTRMVTASSITNMTMTMTKMTAVTVAFIMAVMAVAVMLLLLLLTQTVQKKRADMEGRMVTGRAGAKQAVTLQQQLLALQLWMQGVL